MEHPAIFFDTGTVAELVRNHLESLGYRREHHDQWQIMLTVQGAIVCGVKPKKGADGKA